MKELDKKVNIIPIIAKADTIARSDLGDFKARVSTHNCDYILAKPVLIIIIHV